MIYKSHSSLFSTGHDNTTALACQSRFGLENGSIDASFGTGLTYFFLDTNDPVLLFSFYSEVPDFCGWMTV